MQQIYPLPSPSGPKTRLQQSQDMKTTSKITVRCNEGSRACGTCPSMFELQTIDLHRVSRPVERLTFEHAACKNADLSAICKAVVSHTNVWLRRWPSRLAVWPDCESILRVTSFFPRATEQMFCDLSQQKIFYCPTCHSYEHNACIH